MPQVPISESAISSYGQSPLGGGGGMPSPGNLLMAAAIQSQDPNRSMPSGPDRPRFPAKNMKRKVLDPLKGK